MSDEQGHSNMKKIQESVLEILSNGKEHEYSEIKVFIENKHEDIEMKNGLLSTTLYQMRKKEPNIMMVRNGVYKMVGGENEKTDESVTSVCVKIWLEACNHVNKELMDKNIYDKLNDGNDFMEAKRIFNINKKIYKMIDSIGNREAR